MNLHFDCYFRYPGGFTLEARFDTRRPLTALRGASGSGKTTIVKLMAGLLKPDRGLIRLNDQVFVDTQNSITLAPDDRNLGVVFQDSLLFPHMNVRDNLEYGRRRSASATVAFDDVVSLLEMEPKLNSMPGELSGGEARRVALGRALLRSPQLLLLDEPLTGLDDELKERIVRDLTSVTERLKIPVFLVTHDKSVISLLGAQEVRLEQGRCREPVDTAAVSVHDFSHQWAHEFERLNRQWLEKYFVVEDFDLNIFSDPFKRVIEPGGGIYFACQGSKVVGTCAFYNNDDGAEISKMAVDETCQGQGVGEKLLQHTLQQIRQRYGDNKRIYLITNSQLIPAIRLYEKVGFVITSREPHPIYKRGDVFMELQISSGR